MTAKDIIIQEINENSEYKHFVEYGEGRFITSDAVEAIAESLVKKFNLPVVMQSCDTCKHLSTCRFWQEAPNNGATCKFYIEHVA